MITAKAAQELAQPSQAMDLVTNHLFYIEQQVKAAAGQGETAMPYAPDELAGNDAALTGLTEALAAHDFAVTREGDALTISWAPAA